MMRAAMTEYTVMFEDARWPDLPRLGFCIRASDRAGAIDAAVALFRKTFPLENMANYSAMCRDAPDLIGAPAT